MAAGTTGPVAGFFRRRPPLVRQEHFLSCWAASLVSFLNVCCPALPAGERDIIRLLEPYLGEGERLLWPGLEAAARQFGMRFEELGPGQLTVAHTLARLEESHLWLTYIPGNTARVAAHSVVAWGLGPVTVELMDPFEAYVSRPHEFLGSRTRAFLAWAPRGFLTLSPDLFRKRP